MCPSPPPSGGGRRQQAEDADSTESSEQSESSPAGQTDSLREFTEADVERAAQEVASSIRSWSTENFTFVANLQAAPSNDGQVSKYLSEGAFVAVKKMPRSWVCSTRTEFDEKHPEAPERPWVDLAFLYLLERQEFPYTLPLLGLYRDDVSTYVVSPIATQGDLHSWCENAADVTGPQREDMVFELFEQIVDGMRHLHNRGISHNDISLENFLVTMEPCKGGEGEDEGGAAAGTCVPCVKIIDFGMAMLGRVDDEPRGKPSYTAPEKHVAATFDCFLADAFSCGVVLFCLATEDYPWKSTKPGDCRLFDFVNRGGSFKRYLERRKSRRTSQAFRELLSMPLQEVLQGLLEMNPRDRLNLGEACFLEDEEEEDSDSFMEFLHTWKRELGLRGGRRRPRRTSRHPEMILKQERSVSSQTTSTQDEDPFECEDSLAIYRRREDRRSTTPTLGNVSRTPYLTSLTRKPVPKSQGVVQHRQRSPGPSCPQASSRADDVFRRWKTDGSSSRASARCSARTSAAAAQGGGSTSRAMRRSIWASPSSPRCSVAKQRPCTEEQHVIDDSDDVQQDAPQNSWLCGVKICRL